ncbi:MAG: HEAT repeat domain-containing protein, partial [Kofleriaceae bacterium]|nr:HEAT repeat domain-containing protein [Kofleriaceae bacterium]
MKRASWLALPLLTATLWRTAPAAAWDFAWSGRIDAETAELLRSDDAAQRVAGIRLLGSYDLTLTEDKLLTALSDSQLAVRLEAARVLGQRGSQRATDVLIRWLGDGDVKLRAIAAEALGGIGGSVATEALIRSLGDADGTVRQRTVVALGTIGKRGDATIAMTLIARLEDDKTDVKRAAIEQLVALRERRALIPLAARLGDSSPEVKKDAARALAQLGDRSAAPPLLRMLDESAEDVRNAGFEAVGELGIEEAVSPLTEKLNIGSDSSRSKVLVALAKIAKLTSNEPARARALGVVLDELEEGNRFAVHALVAAGPAAVPYLLRSLDGKLPGSPSKIVDALRQIGDPRATNALIAELDRGRVPMVATLAALAATNDPTAMLSLLTRTASTDPTIRLAAMRALDGMIDQDVRAIDALIERLNDPDRDVRILAVRYLGRLHATAAIAPLRGMLGSGNPYALRLAAIDALGQIAAPSTVNPLFAELHAELFDVRHAASRALAGIHAPSIVAPAMQLLKHDRTGGRPHVLVALLGTARGLPRRDAPLSELVRKLATTSDHASATAATLVLAALATNSVASSDVERAALRRLAMHGVPSVRAAALRGLIDDASPDATATLLTGLASPVDQVGAAAAYALGRRPRAATSAITHALQRAARRSEWATAINASAALWRIGQAHPALLATMGDASHTLVFHRSRLVRNNAGHLLLQQPTSAQRNAHLLRLVQQDDSAFVRANTVRAIHFAGPTPALPPELRQA